MTEPVRHAQHCSVRSACLPLPRLPVHGRTPPYCPLWTPACQLCARRGLRLWFSFCNSLARLVMAEQEQTAQKCEWLRMPNHFKIQTQRKKVLSPVRGCDLSKVPLVEPVQVSLLQRHCCYEAELQQNCTRNVTKSCIKNQEHSKNIHHHFICQHP